MAGRMERLLLAAMACFLIVQGGARGAFAAEREELRRTPVVQAVQKASPAVVNIQASRVVERKTSPFADFFGSDRFFDDIFPGQKRSFVQRSLGSGVIIDGDKRLVLTNSHVITGASDISVRLLDGRSFGADLVGSEPDFDLALLKLSGQGTLPEVSMGSSEDLLIGESVIAIGNPYGFSHTVTTGVISAVDRTVDTKQGTFMGFIQTDAAINPGNSGGPLLNILGRVVGINTAIYAEAQGIGFAIPINKAKNVVQELVSHGSVQPVWLGLAGQDVDQRTASYFGLERPQGMLVTEVSEGTPARRADLRSGDILLSIEGTEIKGKNHYVRLIRNLTREARIELTLWRNEQARSLTLQPAAFSREQALALAAERWGLRLRQGEEALVVSEVLPGSPAQELGLRPGDRIYKIAGQAMDSLNDFVQSFMRYRMQQSIILLVARGDRGYYVRLRL